MTAVRRPYSRVRAGAPRLFLLVALLEEGHADLVAIDPGELAAAVGKAGRRQQQEELLQVKPLDGSLDGELGAGLGNVLHCAIAAPGAVDAHHMRRNPALEGDAIALAPLGRACHDLVPTFRSSCSLAACTFTNFGKSWALAPLNGRCGHTRPVPD